MGAKPCPSSICSALPGQMWKPERRVEGSDTVREWNHQHDNPFWRKPKHSDGWFWKTLETLWSYLFTYVWKSEQSHMKLHILSQILLDFKVLQDSMVPHPLLLSTSVILGGPTFSPCHLRLGFEKWFSWFWNFIYPFLLVFSTSGWRFCLFVWCITKTVNGSPWFCLCFFTFLLNYFKVLYFIWLFKLLNYFTVFMFAALEAPIR